MTLRKIELMYQQFGKCEGHVCKECSNLKYNFYDKKYYKCSVYGNSNAESTDWRVRDTACGMFNKEWKHDGIVKLVRPEKEPEVQLDGQINLFE